MQESLVSILIPFKNTAAFLVECLDSICKQSYTNWEVMAINDASEDQSRHILEQYAQKDKRIQVYDNHGSGIIKALRLAYSKCNGEFITRMDSDDIMAPNRLEIMTNSLLANGKGHIAIGQVKYFSERGISDGYNRYEKWLNGLTAHGNNYLEIYKECVIPSPCWMTYSTDLDACDAFQPNDYPEDYDLAFRFYEKGLKCIPCNQVLLFWRDYDHRTSRTSEHYSQNYFLDIKLRYFLKLEYDKNRPLVIWGAGNKGKEIAKSLLEQQINFHWLCNNPNKIGKNIYGKIMRSYTELNTFNNPQSIVTVANDESQIMIHDYFTAGSQEQGTDYFFFC